jgi:hypothetical protein
MQQENVDTSVEAASNFIALGAAVGFMYGAAWRMENFEKLSHEEIHNAYHVLRANGLANMLDPRLQSQILGMVYDMLSKELAEDVAKLDEQE